MQIVPPKYSSQEIEDFIGEASEQLGITAEAMQNDGARTLDRMLNHVRPEGQMLTQAINTARLGETLYYTLWDMAMLEALNDRAHKEKNYHLEESIDGRLVSLRGHFDTACHESGDIEPERAERLFAAARRGINAVIATSGRSPGG